MDITSIVENILVPERLLRSQQISPSGKLVWIALILDASMNPNSKSSKSRLATITGLSRPTIYKALATLQSNGWYSSDKPCNINVQEPLVNICTSLFLNKELGVRARLFHGLLQITASFKDTTKKFKYSMLSKEFHMGVRTVRNAIGQLVRSGWLVTKQTNQFAPITFSLRNPIKEQFNRMIARAKKNLKKAEHKGEGLMKEFLSLAVASEHYMDNVKPGFLRNVNTDSLMEFDRYYPNVAAFEFNGPQHYHPTDLYSAEDVKEQQARDQQKKQLCDEEKINLIVVHPDDLSLAGILTKINNLLPLRNMLGAERLINYLENYSANYRRKCSAMSLNSNCNDLPPM